jgi:hypothetical protein
MNAAKKNRHAASPQAKQRAKQIRKPLGNKPANPQGYEQSASTQSQDRQPEYAGTD